jgi:hypothetical protein
MRSSKRLNAKAPVIGFHCQISTITGAPHEQARYPRGHRGDDSHPFRAERTADCHAWGDRSDRRRAGLHHRYVSGAAEATECDWSSLARTPRPASLEWRSCSICTDSCCKAPIELENSAAACRSALGRRIRFAEINRRKRALISRRSLQLGLGVPGRRVIRQQKGQVSTCLCWQGTPQGHATTFHGQDRSIGPTRDEHLHRVRVECHTQAVVAEAYTEIWRECHGGSVRNPGRTQCVAKVEGTQRAARKSCRAGSEVGGTGGDAQGSAGAALPVLWRLGVPSDRKPKESGAIWGARRDVQGLPMRRVRIHRDARSGQVDAASRRSLQLSAGLLPGRAKDVGAQLVANAQLVLGWNWLSLRPLRYGRPRYPQSARQGGGGLKQCDGFVL